MTALGNFIEANRQHLPNICHGAEAAHAKFAQHYAATDNSPIYSVATAIYPEMCFQYWIDQQWGATYENNAKKAVRSTWKEQYPRDNCDTVTQPPNLDPRGDNMELTLLGLAKTCKDDQLEEFVSGPFIMEMPLVYWKRNHGSYPHLAKMDKDHFAVPATSAPSERYFPKACLLLPYTRNRLSPDNIGQQMLRNSW